MLTCSIFQGSSPCPPGETCQQLAEGMTLGSCMPAGPNPVGGACGQNNACATLFCFEYYCEQPCQPSGPPTCPTGQLCEDTGGAVGICTTPPEPEPEPEPDTAPTTPDANGGAGTGGASDGESSGGETSVNGGESGQGTRTPTSPGTQVTPGSSGGTTESVSVGCQATSSGEHAGRLWPLLLLVGALFAQRRRRVGRV